ncbi:MAG TPA: isopentenyl phosphate kinase [Candidatus Bathyarchaeia archaeon]|nr:isopentenyl phosphate kinase [Candidatus Bathyarchaeia archaeon]
MDSVTIVKLGGSAITDKTRECTPDIPVIQHVADQLSGYNGSLVIIHGGGSYAHPFAAASGLANGLHRKSQLRSIAETEFYLGQLTRIVCASLLLRNRLPVPLHPLSFVTLDKGKVAAMTMHSISSALKVGLTPLTHGDLVFDESRGIGILSGDRIAALIGARLKASRVLLGCDVDGVYSGDPKASRGPALISEVTPDNFRMVLRASRKISRDATGGMDEKAKWALALARGGCECYIFNLKKRGNLRKLLAGDEDIGTRFLPWKRARKSLTLRRPRA